MGLRIFSAGTAWERAFEDADGDVGVAYIQGEEHGGNPWLLFGPDTAGEDDGLRTIILAENQEAAGVKSGGGAA